MSEDLIAYLGIGHYSPDRIERVLAGIPQHRRAAIERRARYTRELRAWRAGEADPADRGRREVEPRAAPDGLHRGPPRHHSSPLTKSSRPEKDTSYSTTNER